MPLLERKGQKECTVCTYAYTHDTHVTHVTHKLAQGDTALA